MIFQGFLVPFALGIVTALVLLMLLRKAPIKALANWAYLALAIMVSVYVGAHLVVSELPGIIQESVIATVFLGVGLWLKSSRPVFLSGLIFLHGLYDLTMGHVSGVAEWYPPLCFGFDITVAIGLFLIMRKKTSA